MVLCFLPLLLLAGSCDDSEDEESGDCGALYSGLGVGAVLAGIAAGSTPKERRYTETVGTPTKHCSPLCPVEGRRVYLNVSKEQITLGHLNEFGVLYVDPKRVQKHYPALQNADVFSLIMAFSEIETHDCPGVWK